MPKKSEQEQLIAFAKRNKLTIDHIVASEPEHEPPASAYAIMDGRWSGAGLEGRLVAVFAPELGLGILDDEGAVHGPVSRNEITAA